MSNKTEKDIKLLENFADICKKGFYKYDQVEEGYAIERLIKRIRKLEKEVFEERKITVLLKLYRNEITPNKARELLGFPKIKN